MQPHQERVVAEKADLDSKREKLAIFIGGELFPTLEEIEQQRLIYQLEAMNLYALILGYRIEAFSS